MVMTSTVEGRERYGIRLRYPSELRNDPEKLNQFMLLRQMELKFS